jgi:2-polyprenyl-6-hydroxyphenyl methylase/3-demethylubiquinone-9 3-methyltransferase
LRRLLGDGALNGRRFLDVGCGSGVHSVAALKLGAQAVFAFDVDAESVAAAREVLERYAGTTGAWQVEQADLFELDPGEVGLFDVVYAWGVLHHTGRLWDAVRHTAGFVTPGGLLAMALYRRTWLCPLWRLEKSFYARSAAGVQAAVRGIYLGCFFARLLVTGRSPWRYVRSYSRNRGMDFYRDIHDWLGGWPYESTTAAEVESAMRELGFVRVRSFVRSGRFFGKDLGLFGSGCDGYVYARPGLAESRVEALPAKGVG